MQGCVGLAGDLTLDIIEASRIKGAAAHTLGNVEGIYLPSVLQTPSAKRSAETPTATAEGNKLPSVLPTPADHGWCAKTHDKSNTYGEVGVAI